MRSYEDISNRIMQRGDQIIESRKVRAAKIRHTSYAVSGMCAAVITGIGVWRATSSMPQPDNNNSSAIATTETTAEKTVTTADNTPTTQPLTTTKNKNATSAATFISSTDIQTESSSTTTAALPKTTVVYSYTQTTTSTKPAQTSVPTSIIEITSTTSLHEGPVTTVPHKVTTTLNQEEIVKITDKTVISSECHVEAPTTTTSQTPVEVIATLPFDYNEAIRSSHGIFRYNDYLYEKEDALVNPESIGDFIRNISVTFRVSNGWEIVDGMALYEINGIGKEEAVAARLNGTDEYFMFVNVYYKKEDY